MMRKDVILGTDMSRKMIGQPIETKGKTVWFQNESLDEPLDRYLHILFIKCMEIQMDYYKYMQFIDEKARVREKYLKDLTVQ